MPAPDAYMASVSHVPQIFSAVQGAGVPPRFTHEFLKQLGFTSSNDRSVIPVMRALRFLDDNGVPTDRYRRFRDPSLSGAVMAEALRDAYADVFTVNERAHELNTTQLQGAFKRITGKGDAVARKMATTFRALVGLADFTAMPQASTPEEPSEPEEPPRDTTPPVRREPPAGVLSLRHDMHVHLPSTPDVKVYDAIFRSLREHFG
jgi:hypothetical protein